MRCLLSLRVVLRLRACLQAKRVLVMEDSTHEKPVVLTNLKAYGRFVTPGSYLIVQDTRCGRWKPADAVEEFLTLPEGSAFTVDPRWEYMVFSQHNGGFLRKAGAAGPAAVYPEGPGVPNIPNQFA
jgi:cephalosporin hydroxylase